MVKRSSNDSEMESNKRQSRNGKDPMGSTSLFEHHPGGFGIREALDVSSQETYEVLWNVGKQILELADQLGVQFEFQGEAVDGILETYKQQMNCLGVKDDQVLLNTKPRMEVVLKPTLARLKHQIDQVKQVGLDNKSLQSRLLDLGNQVFKMGNQQRKIVQRQKYAEQMSTNNLTYVGIRNAANQYSVQALAPVPDYVRRSPFALNARCLRKRAAQLLRPSQMPPAPPLVVATSPSPLSSPSYEPSAARLATSPTYDSTSHHFESASPPLAFSPTSPSYEPTYQYEPSLTHYLPTSPTYEPSYEYEPSSTHYLPTSPSYEPCYRYEPSPTHYSPTSPSYDSISHHFESTSPPPGFSPTSPSYKPSFWYEQ